MLQRGVAYTAMPSFVNESREDLNALAAYVQFLLLRGAAEAGLAYALDDDGTLAPGFDPAQARAAAREFLAEELELAAGSWLSAPGEVILPPVPRPEATAEALARGKELFLSPRTECSACHGEDGRGKGPNVWTREEGYKLRDDWGFEARPADLTRGIYRGGDRPIDLYRRIAAGIKGTPMPAFGDSLAPEQIWDLVNYVYSLRDAR